MKNNLLMQILCIGHCYYQNYWDNVTAISKTITKMSLLELLLQLNENSLTNIRIKCPSFSKQLQTTAFCINVAFSNNTLNLYKRRANQYMRIIPTFLSFFSYFNPLAWVKNEVIWLLSNRILRTKILRNITVFPSWFC